MAASAVERCDPVTSRKVAVYYLFKLFPDRIPDTQPLICTGARIGNLNMLLRCSIGNAVLCEKSNTDMVGRVQCICWQNQTHSDFNSSVSSNIFRQTILMSKVTKVMSC